MTYTHTLPLSTDTLGAVYIRRRPVIASSSFGPAILTVANLHTAGTGQAWIWNDPFWREGITASIADYETGNYDTFENGDAFFDELKKRYQGG